MTDSPAKAPQQDPGKKPASLGKRAAKAGGWSMVQVLSVHMLRLGSNLIMTRLLVPEAFGLIAIVSVLISGFTLFTDFGIARSIMREPDGDTDRFLRAAWLVKIGRGAMISSGVLVAALLLWLLGPAYAPAGTVYADPVLPGLIAVSALMPLILGFESTARELTARRMLIQYTAALEIVSRSCAIAAMICFAWISPTVWALLAGMLTGPLVKTIGTHVFLPGPRMGFVWDKDIADRLWQYGKWLMGSSIFVFFANSADKFILGSFLDAAALGLFVIASIWIEAGAMVIARLSDQVGFPAISEVLRNRPKDAPRLYRKFQSVIDAICISGFAVMHFGGQTFINLLYTPVYQEAGSYLAILSVRFLALRYNGLNGLLMNLGNSRAMMTISAIRAVAMCVLLPVAYINFGFSAALLVIALVPLVTAPYALWLIRPYLGAKQVGFDVLWLILTLVVAGYVYVTA